MAFTSAGQVHPILQGMTPDDLSGNFDTVYDSDLGGSYVRLARLVPHPDVIALAVGQYGGGRIVFQTGNLATTSSDPGSDVYVEQMLEWAASGSGSDAPWLSENPDSGTVPSDSSEHVDVNFDATGLSVGTYTADIIIANNDPDENPVIVPVTLHVVPTGDAVIMTIEDGFGSPGSTGNPVTISADNQSQNQTPIAAGEFRVVYDGSTGLDLDDVGVTARSSDFRVSYTVEDSDPAEVEVHILLYSLSNATIAPGTGPILELLFGVDPTAQAGDSSELSFTDVSLVDQQVNEIPVDFTDTGQFTIGCVKDGDINDDGESDIFDLQILINMILSSPQPDPTLYPLDWWCRGDLAVPSNGDGQWNVFDLQRLICLILGTCGRGEEVQSRGENLVSIGQVSARPGTSEAFDIDCDNADAISAIEVWFTYDSTIGLEICNVATVARTDGWNVGFVKDESDPSAVEVHVLLYNTNGWVIDPGAGAILAIAYSVDAGASGNSPLHMTQANLADAVGQPLPAKCQDGLFRVTESYPAYLPLVVKNPSS
jgi:hypothetical protein